MCKQTCYILLMYVGKDSYPSLVLYVTCTYMYLYTYMYVMYTNVYAYIYTSEVHHITFL